MGTGIRTDPPGRQRAAISEGHGDLVSTGNDVSVGEDDTLAGVDEHAGAPRSHLRIRRKVARAGGALRPLALGWRGIRCRVAPASNADAHHSWRYLLCQR